MALAFDTAIYLVTAGYCNIGLYYTPVSETAKRSFGRSTKGWMVSTAVLVIVSELLRRVNGFDGTEMV